MEPENAHEVAATDFERGIQYGDLLHRVSEQERRHTEYSSRVDSELAELRARLDTNSAVAEVALAVASDASETAHEAEDAAEHAEHVAERDNTDAAEVAEVVAEHVAEEVAAEHTDETSPIVVGETEHVETPEPEPEPKHDRRRRNGVYGRRR